MLTTKITKTLGLFVATCFALQAAQAAPRLPVMHIYEPPSITSPTNNAQVSSPLTIRGTARKNNQVQVHVVAHYSVKLSKSKNSDTVAANKDLGLHKADADDQGKWSTAPVTLQLPKGALNPYFEITASQKIGNENFKSSVVKVSLSQVLGTVRTPVFNAPLVVPPNIISPQKAAYVTFPMTVRGTGVPGHEVSVDAIAQYSRMPGSNRPTTVTLGTLRTTVKSDGTWIVSPFKPHLPDVKKEATSDWIQINATQLFPNGKKAKAEVLQVFEAAPPRITSPQQHEFHIGSPMTVRGRGVPGHEVQVIALGHYYQIDASGYHESWHNTYVALPRVTVTSNGTWVASAVGVVPPVATWLKDGSWVKIHATQFFSNNRSTRSEVTIYPTAPPKITSPRSSQDVDSPMVVHGKGDPGRQVEVTVGAHYTVSEGGGTSSFDRSLGSYRVTVNSDGTWKTPPFDLELPYNKTTTGNSIHISVTQFFPNGKGEMGETVQVFPN